MSNPRLPSLLLSVVITLLCGGCMSMDYLDSEDFDATGRGLFIVNQGNFQYGNATLTYYIPSTSVVENEVFARANGQKLGDTAQSMVVRDGTAWIVVNNSHVIFAIDADSFKLTGHIEGFTSPRHIHFVSDDKAYVSQLYDNRIAIVDPRKRVITGYITVPDMLMGSGSTEQMAQVGQYVYVTCWSYQNRVIKIDTTTDKVVGSLEVGVQPCDIVADAYGQLWVLCDGGYAGNALGHEAPKIVRIATSTFSVDKEYRFKLGDQASSLAVNGDRSAVYWINGGVWKMSVSAGRLPAQPLIAGAGQLGYGLTVDPATSEIYVADAIDYQQRGIIYRYSPDGDLINKFYAGVNPGYFCWKP